MQDYQVRVVTERNELTEKIEKLTAFVEGEKFASVESEEASRLKNQLRVMREYQSILDARLKAFK